MSDISAASSLAPIAIDQAKSQISASKTTDSLKVTKHLDRINKTAQDFEAVFVTEVMRPMWNMMKVDEDFGGGKGEEVFKDFTLNEYGKRIASQGGFGIAAPVKEQLIRMQAAQEHPGANPVQLAAGVADIKARMKNLPPSAN